MAEQGKHTTCSGTPYPKYLIDYGSRNLIRTLEDAGFPVELTAPAPGSVAVTITTPTGETHSQIGRPEDLERTIRLVAKESGFDL